MNDAPRELKTVREVVDAYLRQAKRELVPDSYEETERILRLFVADLGERPVSTLRPFDLLEWIDAHPTWKSNCTLRRVAASVKKSFSWALKMGLISATPFVVVRYPPGGRRRPITEAEFAALLRHSAAEFRRILCFLRWTGMRPIEARLLTWNDVDLERRLICLREHKTIKTQRNPRPRIIPLAPPALKLLLWIRRSQADILQGVLGNGPVACWKVRARLRRRGLTLKALTAAITSGAIEVRSAPKANRPWDVKTYELVRKANGVPVIASQHVFTNTLGQPLNRHTLNKRFIELRKRAGLPKDCKLYGTRHLWATMAAKNGVSMLLLSRLLGHTTCAMSQWYIDVAALEPLLEEAMLQALYGPKASPKEQEPANGKKTDEKSAMLKALADALNKLAEGA